MTPEDNSTITRESATAQQDSSDTTAHQHDNTAMRIACRRPTCGDTSTERNRRKDGAEWRTARQYDQTEYIHDKYRRKRGGRDSELRTRSLSKAVLADLRPSDLGIRMQLGQLLLELPAQLRLAMAASAPLLPLGVWIIESCVRSPLSTTSLLRPWISCSCPPAPCVVSLQVGGM